MSIDEHARATPSGWRGWLWAGLAYTLLALLMTYPLIVELTDSLAGYHGDILIFMWDRWWLREALQAKTDPLFTPYLSYPQGASLVFHSMSWLNVGTWLALEPLFGVAGSYNLTVLANIVICGLSTFALGRYLKVRDGVAFVGGLIYAYYPHHISNVLTQPNLASVQWLPLYMLFLIKSTRGGRFFDGVLAGMFVALTALADWHLLTMTGVLTLLWLVYSLVREHRFWHRRSLRNLLFAACIAAILIGPAVLPIISYLWREEAIEGILTSQEHVYQSDLLAYVTPSRLHSVWRGERLESFYRTYFIRHRNWQAFLGYAVLALMGYAFVTRRRSGSFWAFAALVLWVLALGPYLRVAGRLVFGIPLPYWIVENTSLFRTLRAPDRFNALLALPVSMLATLSLERIVKKVSLGVSQWTGRLVNIAVGGLILFEFLIVPFPMRRPSISPFYESLKADSDAFAIADLPVGWRASRYYMYYQTVHGHPIVEGHISRPVGDAYQFIRQNPLLSRVGEDDDWKLSLPDISRQLNVLADADVRYLVLHQDRAKEHQLSAWHDWITLQPIYEDEQVLVYDTRPVYGRDFQWQHDLGARIGVIQASLGSDAVSQGSVLEVEVRWGSRLAPEQELSAEIALVSMEGDKVQEIRQPVLQDWPTDQWSSGTVAVGHYSLQVTPFIPAGTYSLQLSLLDAATQSPVGGSVIIGTIAVHNLPRRFAPAEPTNAIDVAFADQLYLYGYDMQVDQANLALTLYWRAESRMEVMWKFFVHLVDPDTRAVVTQADVMPHDWQYPTTWWMEGEYVEDTIVISLEGVPSGTFDVLVGVYHPETGDRLLTRGGNDSLVLPDPLDR